MIHRSLYRSLFGIFGRSKRSPQFSLTFLFILVAICAFCVFIYQYVEGTLGASRRIATIQRTGGRLTYYSDLYEDEAQRIGSPSDVFGVDLAGCQNVDSIISLIPMFKSVDTLILQRSDVSESGLRYLAKCDSLRCIDLRSVLLSPAAWSRVGDCATLEEIYVDPDAMDARGITAVGKLRKLKKLGFSRNSVAPEMISRIAEGLPDYCQIEIPGELFRTARELRTKPRDSIIEARPWPTN